jgi:predicted PurR-regulated permease PerM
MTLRRRLLAVVQALLCVALFVVFFGAWVFAPLGIFAIALAMFLAAVILHLPARLERLRRRSRGRAGSDDA